MKKQINWSRVFNTFKQYGDIAVAAKAAQDVGYPYFLWNDRVYDVDLKDTGYQRRDLDSHLYPGYR